MGSRKSAVYLMKTLLQKCTELTTRKIIEGKEEHNEDVRRNKGHEEFICCEFRF